MKLFRVIRRHLLERRHFSKYLLYATGEIVLIVIGILIALEINNQNQQRLIKNKEMAYLNGLKEEFTTSRAKLARLIEVNKSNIKSSSDLLKALSDTNTTLTEQQLSNHLVNTLYRGISYHPTDSLLREIISSGSLKDISNHELRARLANWSSALRGVANQEQELSRQREHVLDIFRGNEYHLKTILDFSGMTNAMKLPLSEHPLGNLAVLQAPAFENNLLMFLLTSEAANTTHYKPLMEEIDSILELIAMETGKN